MSNEPEHNFEICKRLCQEVYNKDVPEKINEWIFISSQKSKEIKSGGKISVTEHMNFAYVAYKNEELKEIIIAYRGTNDKLDIITDLNFVFEKIPIITPKFAKNSYNELKNKYKNYKIYLTGHSLGGAYAQLLCAQLMQNQDICFAITFNAPGMDYALEKTNATKAIKYSNISNYVIMNDFIGNFRAHIGNTYYIQPIPFNKIIRDNKKLTPHGGILYYDKNFLGQHHSKPTGFGTKEAWALYSYDCNNDESYKTIIKSKVRPKNLLTAIEIIKDVKNNIKLLNNFEYIANKKNYSLS